MWFLTFRSSDSYVFINKSETKVGRNNSDLNVENDDSISRSHAILLMKNEVLFLKDTNSKYGTFLKRASNDEKVQITAGEGVMVLDGDEILFGRFNSIYKVHHVNFKTSTSMLSPDKIAKLTKKLAGCGIKISEEFNESCSHLTVNSKTEISQKVVTALVMCKPIVTTKFWDEVALAMQNNSALPDHSKHTAQMTNLQFDLPDSALIINHDRQTVFRGKKFIFTSTTHQKKHEATISGGGGESVSLSKQKMRIEKVVDKNTIFVQPMSNLNSTPSGSNQELLKKINLLLTSRHLRMIPDYEISLAILYASTERFCNVNLNSVTSLFNPTQKTETGVSKSVILAPATSAIEDFNTAELSLKTQLATTVESDLLAESATDKENFESINIPETPLFDENENKKEEVAGKTRQETQKLHESLEKIEDVLEMSRQSSSSSSRKLDVSAESSRPSSSSEKFFDFSQPSSTSSRSKKRIHRKNDIFDFTISDESKSVRESSQDLSVKEVEEPSAKRNKLSQQKLIEFENSMTSSSSSQSSNRSTRKRKNDQPSLFDFGMKKDTKKQRFASKNSEQSETQTSSTSITVQKSQSNFRVQKSDTRSFYLDEDDNSSGWISRSMSKLTTKDSSDKIDDSNHEQSLIVVENMTWSQMSKNVTETKRGKCFVKKNNFKKQTEVIKMALGDIEN